VDESAVMVPASPETFLATGDHSQSAVDLADLLALAAPPAAPDVAQHAPEPPGDDLEEETHGPQYGGPWMVAGCDPAELKMDASGVTTQASRSRVPEPP
jgi:hypothetical protein